uniref:Nicotinamide riboside transporter PnuC n=1 Tax=Syphacia muris TaxID=451379 RepID=A0A0N5AC43_9BILA
MKFQEVKERCQNTLCMAVVYVNQIWKGTGITECAWAVAVAMCFCASRIWFRGQFEYLLLESLVLGLIITRLVTCSAGVP